MNYPLVLIEWVDASCKAEWTSHEDILDWGKEELVINSVGYLVGESKRYFILSSTMSPEMLGSSMKIPKSWVKKKVKLCQGSTSK